MPPLKTTAPVLAILLLACSTPASPPAAAPPPTAWKLTVAGSSTIQPVAEIAGQAFEKLHPEGHIDVQGGGSSVGISSARSGLSDIGTVSRGLKPEESDLTATPIGLDGIALVVNAKNPLAAITKEQVVAVYSGVTTSWGGLGWEDHPITVVSKEEGRSTLELFQTFFGLKDKVVANAVIIGPNGQAITTVAGNPYAIAYVSIGSASVAEADGTAIRRLALDGVAATVENVSTATYPLMRPLNLVTKGPPTGRAKEFIDFVRSPEGQAIVRKEDFVAVGNAAPAL